MEYLKPKRKKDLVNTMRMLNENNYLIYADDPNNKNCEKVSNNCVCHVDMTWV